MGDRSGNAAPAAHVIVETEWLFEGEPFDVTVLVNAAPRVTPPVWESSSDMDVAFRDATLLRQGRRTGHALRYSVTPKRPGNITLPALTLKADGIPVTTPPTTLTIRAPVEHPDTALAVELSAETCYVGEPLTLTVTWTTSLAFHGCRAVSLRVPVLHHRNIRVPLGGDSATAGPGKRLGIPVGTLRLVAAQQTIQTGDGRRNQLRFEQVVVPTKAGAYRFPASRLRHAYSPPVGTSAPSFPSYFNNSFFDPPGTGPQERMVAASQPLPLTVNPLPVDGRPAGFSGQVGVCEVTTVVDRTSVRVGDPILLTISVTGPKRPETVVLPNVANQLPFSGSFGLPAELPAGHTDQHARTMTLPLRPLRAGIEAVPPVQLAYFDPATGRYGVARSDPIPITVSEAATTTAADVLASGGLTLRNRLIAHQAGLRHNADATQCLRRGRQGGGWLLLAGLSLPPIFFAGFVVTTADRRLKRRDPDAHRAKHAYVQFRRAAAPIAAGRDVDRARAFRILEEALRQYLASRLGLTRLTDLRDAGVPADLAAVESVYRMCEQERYGRKPSSMTIRDVAARALDAVRQVDRAMGRPKRSRRRLALLCLAVTLAGTALSQDADDLALCHEANASFAEANRASLSDPDRALALYREAAHLYVYLIEERGVVSAPLHGNLANTYVSVGDLGKALVHFHRALRLDPTDDDIRASLEYARGLRIDEFQPSWRDGVRRVAAASAGTPLAWRLVLFAILHGLFWLLAVVRLTKPSRYITRAMAAAAAGAMLVLLSVLSSVCHWGWPVDGVIVAKEVTARHGDGYVYESAFESPLHAGTEFRLVETREAWLRMQLPDNTTCWVPKHAARTIREATP